MEMTFGKAHDIWGRAVSGDGTLSEDDVKDAAKWFYDFIDKLNEKASQSKQDLDDAVERHEDDAVIEKKRKAAESDMRQVDDFIKKYDDLIAWLILLMTKKGEALLAYWKSL